ncbi:MAG: hypothetical protein ACYS18_03065 [Planctomycetota bacterium]
MEDDLFVVVAIGLQISVEAVLIQLGYSDLESVSSGMRDKVGAELAKTQSLIEPKGLYLRLAEGDFKGFELFSGAQRMILALATIGPALEQYSKNLVVAGEGARGLIADAIGTVAVEQAADFLERKIQQDCSETGLKVSRRYSPGYCGWKIEAQRQLFSRFDDTLGIKLTESCLMIPEKSLSFVCLLSRTGNFSSIRVGNCKECRQKGCPYRTEPYGS